LRIEKSQLSPSPLPSPHRGEGRGEGGIESNVKIVSVFVLIKLGVWSDELNILK
jgi:hypothetical protein